MRLDVSEAKFIKNANEFLSSNFYKLNYNNYNWDWEVITDSTITTSNAVTITTTNEDTTASENVTMCYEPIYSLDNGWDTINAITTSISSQNG